MIGLFKTTYTVRKYGQQEIVNGYATSPYEDVKMRLDVQPLSSDELQALPEGERSVKRLKAYGGEKLTAADENTQTPGDRLYYDGNWYECKSSVHWNHHALIRHYNSDFVICYDQTKPPKIEELPGGDDNDEPDDTPEEDD